MKPLSASRILALIASLAIVGCSTTESSQPSHSANVPPKSTDSEVAGVAEQTNSAPAEITAPSDENASVPLDKLPKKKGYPYAIKTKWPDLVKSPYAQDKTLVNVSGLPSGSPARCPHTGKIFIVP